MSWYRMTDCRYQVAEREAYVTMELATGKTLHQIGADLGISPGRVGQLDIACRGRHRATAVRDPALLGAMIRETVRPVPDTPEWFYLHQ